jgi:prepilin-type N-terminal cleavage/methylation domain-containing protein
MRLQRGFTLMELLVVLLIIGVLSSVALRTIDATRDRGLYEQTVSEMKSLVYSVTGNPDLVVNGQRTDYGFYGDMRRLPTELRELVENTTHSADWRGPYLRREFVSDSTGYLSDAWGHPYTYDQTMGTIASPGNGRFPMTVRVVDSVPHLDGNTVSGTVTDSDNSPPGDQNEMIRVFLTLPGGLIQQATPDRSGYYSYQNVPMGNHPIVAMRPGGDSIARWVSVAPRSRTVVDFRFSRPFRNYLRMVGPPEVAPDGDGFTIQVVNEGATDDTVSSVTFLDINPQPESAFHRMLWIKGLNGERLYEDTSNMPGYGENMTRFFPNFLVGPDRSDVVFFGFLKFCKDTFGLAGPRLVSGGTFRMRFSDGSEITVTP